MLQTPRSALTDQIVIGQATYLFLRSKGLNNSGCVEPGYFTLSIKAIELERNKSESVRRQCQLYGQSVVIRDHQRFFEEHLFQCMRSVSENFSGGIQSNLQIRGRGQNGASVHTVVSKFRELGEAEAHLPEMRSGLSRGTEMVTRPAGLLIWSADISPASMATARSLRCFKPVTL